MQSNLEEKNEAISLEMASPRVLPDPVVRKRVPHQPKFHRCFSTGTIPTSNRQTRPGLPVPQRRTYETDISPVSVGGFPSQLHHHINKLFIQQCSFSSRDLQKITLVSDNARLLPFTAQATPFKVSPFLSNSFRDQKTCRWTSETPASPSISSHSLFSPSSSSTISSTRISRKAICEPESIPPPPIELSPITSEAFETKSCMAPSITSSDSTPIAPQRPSGRYFKRTRSIIVDIEEGEDEDINEDDIMQFPPPTNTFLAMAARRRSLNQYGRQLESKQDSLLVRPERRTSSEF